MINRATYPEAIHPVAVSPDYTKHLHFYKQTHTPHAHSLTAEE